MKTIKTFILFTILIISQYSCDDSFLESYPKNALSAETFFTNATDFNSAVNGIYDVLQEGSTEFTYFPMMDCATPWIGAGKSRFGVWDYGMITVTPSWGISGNYWSVYYKVINRANEILAHVDDETIPLSDKDRNRIKGETLFLRAFAYFYLQNFFGDVPLILNKLGFDELNVSRTAREQVVEQTIADLKTAAELLPSVKEYRSNKAFLGRASKGAAQTLLGKLYLFEKNYSEAEKVFKSIIDIGDYDLEPNFNDMFWPDGENGIESIFEIQYNQIQGNRYVRFSAPNANSKIHYKGYNYVNARQHFVDLYETVNGYSVTSTYIGDAEKDPSRVLIYEQTSDDPAFDVANPFQNRDPRLKWTVWYEDTPYIQEFESKSGQSGINYKSGYSNFTNYNTVKYIVGKFDITGNDSPQNYIVMRYADVLLMYAETLLEQSKPGVETYINMVRSRPSVNMPDIPSSLSENELRDELRKERVRELACEYGHLYLDMRRWDTLSDAMVDYWTENKDGGVHPALGSYSKDYYLWPIPQNEMDANHAMTKNNGY